MLVFLIGTFLLLLILGVPIIAAMGIPAMLYLIIEDIPLSTMTYSMFQSLNSFTMIAVPMFILMGTLVNVFGQTDRVFDFAKALLKNSKGYSAKVNVVISLIFAGASGAALADIGGLGRIQIRAMENEGFTRGYASALTVATATVGPIFPPSVPLIIFALIAQVSGVKALLAGLIPGLLVTFCLYVFVILTNKQKLKNASDISTDPLNEGELWRSFKRAFPMILAAPIIILGMLFGMFSPGEAGAMGVLYLLLVGFLHREVSWKRLLSALKETFLSTCTILLVVVTGAIFTKTLTLEKLPDLVSSTLLNFTDNVVLILLILNLVLLIIGLFMESISALILMTPIILTVGSQIGADPIHLGVIMVLNLMIGMTTPPFGMSLYAVADVAKVSPISVIKELLPLYVPLILALLVITFIPSLSLWIPSLLN